MINCSNQFGKKIILKEKKITHFVELTNIIYLMSDSYLTKLYLVNSEVITVSKLLKEFEKELLEYAFVRISKSVIVNLTHVNRIIHHNGKILIKIQNIQFPITRSFLE